MEILLQKSIQGHLIPSSDEDFEKVRRFKVGAVVRCELTQMRNYRFHKKWFALVKIAFDAWSEGIPKQEYKGIECAPDFERFRKDLIILCGFYRPVFNVRQEMRLEAESISFANMDEDRFEELFSQTINVVLEKILPHRGFSEAKLRHLVNQVVGFD